ncbi:ABC transporter substrate-binding protein [Paenibacillus mucilaginosus]|uniref:Extracellular solute-binding protein family 1 n=1 Tax=Paenibacillus mucilaginosus (strain KNP414) TaxID=1036673 RepID=F8F667_PAEMK|nr:ABC transporter substrate-binding protein [Paenibacillus mucilaginosus]AEI42341.1 extracellular solute-binding protein family 1 [Paenibacillus mucilaginosus KNP414]MCG7214297.1 ABC transporter substrate-binding protein [Paenibacillus mucilaginosus]WDM28805.1 ABC transporter substrate-binding protein [Paenibacillus mucilaginosus]
MKKTHLLCTAALLMGTLAACGGPEEPAATGAAPAAQPASEKPAEGGKTTVQFWHSLGGKNGEYMDAMVKRFNDSHPNVEVVATFQGSYDEMVTKLQQSLPSKTAPDVAMLERAYVEMFADADVLEDLGPLMKSSNLSEGDFVSGLMGHSTFNNKLVSLPLNRSTPILHINKTLLDEKGLKVPTTWDELKTTAEALVVKEGGEVKRYGLTMPFDTWYPMAMITQAGGTFFSEDKKTIGFYDNGVGSKVFGYLKDLQGTGALFYPPAKDSGNIVNQMFTSGKAAMMFQSTGTIGSLINTAKFEYVTAYLPKDQKFASPTGGANVAMMSSSGNKQAAWEFIRWMETDPQGALPFILQSGYLPFTKAMAESKELQDLWAKEPARKVAYEQLQYAVDTNKSVAWPEVMKEFNSVIEAVMYDNKDIQASLETFKKQAERILAGQ